MAIQLNITAPATSTYLTHDGSLHQIYVDASPLFGWCAWFRRDADTGSREEIFNLAGDVVGSGGSNTREGIHIAADIPGIWQGAAGGDFACGGTLAVGTWMFIARTAINVFSGHRYYGLTSTLTEPTAEPAGISTSMDNVVMGRYPASDANQARFSIAHVRIWSGVAPSQADFEAEMIATTPQRNLANLWANYELESDINDGSGHGYHLTRVGTDYSFVAGPIAPAQGGRQNNPTTRGFFNTAVHQGASW